MWIIDLIQSALAAENNDYRKVLGDVAIACKNKGFFGDPNWNELLNSTFNCVEKTAGNLQISNDAVVESKALHLMCESENKISDDCQISNTLQSVKDAKELSEEDNQITVAHSDDEKITGNVIQLLTKVSVEKLSCNAEMQGIPIIETELPNETVKIFNRQNEDDQTINGKGCQINIGNNDQIENDEQLKNEYFDSPEIRKDEGVLTMTENECGGFDETTVFVKSRSLKRNCTNASLDLEDVDENLFTQMQLETSTPVKSSEKKHKPNEIINFDLEPSKNYEFMKDLKEAKWSQLCDEVNEQQSNVKFLSLFDQCKELRIILEKEIFLESAEHRINVANLQKSGAVSNVDSNVQIKNSKGPEGQKSAISRKRTENRK